MYVPYQSDRPKHWARGLDFFDEIWTPTLAGRDMLLSANVSEIFSGKVRHISMGVPAMSTFNPIGINKERARLEV